jgi:hypothetical protein
MASRSGPEEGSPVSCCDSELCTRRILINIPPILPDDAVALAFDRFREATNRLPPSLGPNLYRCFMILDDLNPTSRSGVQKRLRNLLSCVEHCCNTFLEYHLAVHLATNEAVRWLGDDGEGLGTDEDDKENSTTHGDKEIEEWSQPWLAVRKSVIIGSSDVRCRHSRVPLLPVRS